MGASRVAVAAPNADAAQFILRTRINHLYALHYEASSVFMVFGAGDGVVQRFYPVGQAALSFELCDAATQKVIARWSSSEAHIFDPNAAGADSSFDGRGITDNAVADNDSSEVVHALSKVYLRFPGRLESALVAAGARPGAHAPKSCFFITRQLADYEHMEIAKVDRRSGQVLETSVVRRELPIFSQPGEWVVSPYQPELLAAADYRRLVEELAEGYLVAFEGNLSAAAFKGQRPVTASNSAVRRLVGDAHAPAPLKAKQPAGGCARKPGSCKLRSPKR